jgi:hypothetical protein
MRKIGERDRNVWKRHEKGIENLPKKGNFSRKCRGHQIFIEIGELEVKK